MAEKPRDSTKIASSSECIAVLDAIHKTRSFCNFGKSPRLSKNWPQTAFLTSGICLDSGVRNNQLRLAVRNRLGCAVERGDVEEVGRAELVAGPVVEPNYRVISINVI